jgi:hypothetical protein
MSLSLLSGVLTAALSAGGVSADLSYTEAIDGELSSDRLAPTFITLTPGSNRITGTFGPSGVFDVWDLDYVTITIPAGHSLVALTLVSVSVGGAVSFIGLEEGEHITVPLESPDPAPLLGWTHFGNADEALDLLPAIAAGPGAMGFTPPLAARQYALWIMELDMSQTHSYSFYLSIVPDPPACPADFNNDGNGDVPDIFAFLAAWFASDATAEFDGQPGISVPDIFSFLSLWFVGCP